MSVFETFYVNICLKVQTCCKKAIESNYRQTLFVLFIKFSKVSIDKKHNFLSKRFFIFTSIFNTKKDKF